MNELTQRIDPLWQSFADRSNDGTKDMSGVETNEHVLQALTNLNEQISLLESANDNQTLASIFLTAETEIRILLDEKQNRGFSYFF